MLAKNKNTSFLIHASNFEICYFAYEIKFLNIFFIRQPFTYFGNHFIEYFTITCKINSDLFQFTCKVLN